MARAPKEKTLREEIESEYIEEETTDEEPELDEPEIDESEPTDDDDEGDTEGDTEGDDEAEEGGEEKSTKIGDAEGKEEPPGINAPLGFTPESREQWKAVPQIVKEQIHKREQEIETAMRGTAEARRTHTEISRLAQSYAPILAAEGAKNPMEAIEGLFKTVSALRVGSPQQIASKMAGLISHYGVDISMLDSALSGQEPRNSEMSQMERMMEQRMAPMNEFLRSQQTNQQQQQEQSQAAVATELEQFAAKAEFLNDVRYDMADLIDMASKQGRKMSFEEAYKKACAMNSSISSVMESRAAAEKLKNSGKVAAGKKNASSSLRANSGAASGGKGNQTLRGEIESLWDSYSD